MRYQRANGNSQTSTMGLQMELKQETQNNWVKL